jgi:hypothetical protein
MSCQKRFFCHKVVNALDRLQQLCLYAFKLCFNEIFKWAQTSPKSNLRHPRRGGLRHRMANRSLTTEAKMWASCQGLHGTQVVIAVTQTIPSGHRAAPSRMYAFHPHGALWWWLLIPLFLRDYYGTQKIYREKMAKAIKQPCNSGTSVDNPVCGRCHMVTETASHILCECMALAELIFRRLGEHFYGTKRLW